MKNKIQQIKNTWTWNHKMLLVTLSLIVVVVIQAFPISIPVVAVAYEKPAPRQEIVDSLTASIEKRTTEIHAGMIQEARIKAVAEAYEQLGELIKLTGADYAEYEEVLSKIK